jgi:Bacteriophage head to tail connecting protein
MPTEKPMDTKEYLARYEELESEKKPWLIHFQALAEIFLTRKMDFTRVIIPGQFLQADVFDNTAQFAAYLFASVFLSMMWPDSVRTFKLRPARRLRKLPGVEEYFRSVTHELHEAMDHPKAGLSMALMEHFLDTGIFATSGIATFEGPEDDPELPIVYEAWGIKQMCLAENAQGIVDTVYYLRQLTVRQVVLEYSKPGDSIPERVQQLYDARKFSEKIDVLTVIEPKTVEKGKKGIAAMAYRTVHIAKEHGIRMRVGGFDEMPIAIGRLFKSLDEPYGRSCGMIALPDAQSLNTLTEAVLVATEKLLDPPLGILDDGRLGGGIVDTSSGAINVFNSSGRIGNEKPIFPINTVGELNSALEQQKELSRKIMQAFFLDRLLDLNNQTQMTAYETSVRDKIRGESVGGVFSRQEKEVFTPMIERSFNILFRKGYLGVIETGPGAELRRKWDKLDGAQKVVVPDVLIKAHQAGLNIFEVEYISPAKRFQRAEKLRGLMTAIDSIVAVQPVIPGVTDKIDGDVMCDSIFELTGAPMDVLRTDDAVKKFRAANAAKAAEQEKLQQTEQQANIGLKAAQARGALGTAQPAGIAPGVNGK